MLWKDSDMDGSEAALRKNKTVPANPPSSGISDVPGWTPGPWSQSHRRDERDGMYSTEVYDATGETIAFVAWHVIDKAAQVLRTDRAANARLIAAAPDLYQKGFALFNVAADIREAYIETRGTESEPGWLTDLIEAAREFNTVLTKARGSVPQSQDTERETGTGSQEKR